MKYLNIGCGYNYSISELWTNLDFVSTGKGVIAHNLLAGIPFQNNCFDLVYHSHVLEHFSKEDGEKLISECFRVLKPGGIIRIAVPDLERIVRNYLRYLEEGIVNPENDMIKYNYDWTMLEMYDQTVRNNSGGNMAKYLFQNTIQNEQFVFERIGEEGRSLRQFFLEGRDKASLVNSPATISENTQSIFTKLKARVKKYILKKLKIDEKLFEIGKFRKEGEVHQWMYDRYSLYNLLKDNGGNTIVQRDAFTSFDNNWAFFYIDGKDGVIRKPDSLFMEAIK